jgi:hemoglobin-like flavoprotein
MVRTEVKISMKKKYSACLYFKLLKSYPNKYIYNQKKNKKKQKKRKLFSAIEWD